MNKNNNKIKQYRFVKTTLAICISAALIPAQAAEQEAKEQIKESEQVEVIEITGIRNALTSSMTEKRQASQVQDSISATDIGEFSDANIAEALQRVPGIQIGSSDSGEGDSVALRGLRQTLSLVDGRTVFTGGTRNVNYSDIPSEAMKRVDVTKSAMAKQIEGGISGNIDMRRLKSTDFTDFKAAVTVGAEYADLAADVDELDPVSPKISLVLGNNWQTGMGDFGALLAVNYQERQAAFERSKTFRWRDDVPEEFNPPEGAKVSYGNNIVFGQEETERTNVLLGFDWVPNNDLSLFLDTGFTQYESVQRREAQVFSHKIKDLTAITFDDSGHIVTTQFNKATYNALSQYNVRDTDGYNVAIGGEYSLGNMQFNAEVSYTDSDSHKEEVNMKPEAKSQNNVLNMDYTNARHRAPSVSVFSGGEPLDVSDPDNYKLRQYRDRTQDLTGSETAARFDFTYDLDDGVIESIDAGIRVTSRDAVRDSFDLKVNNPAGDLTVPDELDGLFIAGSDNFYAKEGGVTRPQGMVIADSKFLRDNKEAVLQAYGIGSIYDTPLENDTYDFTEKTYAAYAQLNMVSELAGIPVSGNVGVRAVKTDISSTGAVLQEDGSYEPLTVDTDENHILPSLNVKFDLSDELLLRFAASTTMGRPSFMAMSPSTTNLNYEEFTGKAGNPYLKAFTSDNADVSLEWYFNDNSYVAGSLFYKKVDGFLRTDTIQQTYDGVEFDITSQTNGEEGDIKGLEVAYQQFFDFLPGYFQHLGVQLNGTWIDSEAPSTIEGRDLPLEGLSEYSYNVVGIYAHKKFSARIAWNWRDDYFHEVNNDDAVFREASGSLSASMSYRASKNLKVSLKGKNLTRTELHSYYENMERPENFGYSDKRVELSVSYKL